MHSLPPPNLDRVGNALTRALSRVDGCPECVHNTEPPRAAVPSTTGWWCSYLCSDCGHTWTTDWADC
jgi:hypothetical protein